MPRAATKRTLEEIANAEDSNDDDYDDDAPASSRPKHRSRRRGESAVPLRKKQRRTGYKGSDISDEDESGEEEEWTDEGGDEEVETNERGRPVRRSAKKAVTYEESDEEETITSDSSDSDRVKRSPKKKKSKIVKLKVSTTLIPNASRSLRNRAGSHSANHPSSSSAAAFGLARRSSRLSHDDGEELIELSRSGHHAKVVRGGSQEPERASRASKGIKHPSKSTIDEEDEEQDLAAKEEDDDQMEIKASQHDIPEDDPDNDAAYTAAVPQIMSDLPETAITDPPDLRIDDAPQVADQQSIEENAEGEDDDDEEGPVSRGRITRGGAKRKASTPPIEEPQPTRRRLRNRSARGGRSKGLEESSDFDPEGEQEDPEGISESETSDISPQKGLLKPEDGDHRGGRRSTRLRSRATSRQASGSDDDELEADELAEELAELKKDGKRKRTRGGDQEIVYEPRGSRRGERKNYNLMRNLQPIEEDDDVAAPSPSQRPTRKNAGGGWQRNLFSTYGPFGGAGGPAPVLGGPARGAGDGDSDSSDDEIMKQPKPVGGAVGMTPTTANAPFNPFALQTLNSDPAQATAGTPANLGKVKDKQALADADPLGVDQNVDFDSVGGLEGHIDQLKEMVTLPLLYPEIFMRFKITPPRGVLFHGPPGTGKTLLARALATSVSSHGRKVTFYMRKGADALSKWVGEAERQLRLLFEEARKTQPSIIFFDEIDGLAPVRSSKQEQIHASIVSTLLALMDGMDGRGQVIVIGATNRPDSIDPALRRPGRFDREFYFPLPDVAARRSILNIHTRGWDPPLDENIKDELAALTKGYGGADLRALCTEAALNAVQRKYPQIYRSKEKLLIDPSKIEVMPKDFMLSIKKMTPSSERSASSGASPLPPSIAPLLQRPLSEIEALVAEVLPRKKKTTALEEAMYEDAADGSGFGRERMSQAFESGRVFRPRLLIHGKVGMGQQYLAAALLNHFQGIHVQNFDLPTLLSDTTSSPEATVIRLFSEVKMHKPSVIYIPNVQEWYNTVGRTVITTFLGLLRSIKPTDPILVLGFLECEAEEQDMNMKHDLFGYSKRNQYELDVPKREERLAFFEPLREYINTAPNDFPDPTQRKKRKLEVLKPAPPEPEKPPPPLTKEQLKAQKKKDRQTLNMLKIRLQPIMDQIRTRYKKFRTGVIDDSVIRYLYDEADSGTVTSDVAVFPPAQASYRPFEISKDAAGVSGLLETATGNFFYNLDSVTIEKRLSNGYYKRPKDFLAEIKRLAKDAKKIGDEDRLLKANELYANVEVDVAGIEMNDALLTQECERVYQREQLRIQEALAKEANGQAMPPPRQAASGVLPSITTTSDETGQIRLGESLDNAKDMLGKVLPVTPVRDSSTTSVLTNGYHRRDDELARGRPSDSTSGHDADVENDTTMLDSLPTSHDRSNATQRTHTSSSFDNARNSAQPRDFTSMTAPSQALRREAGVAAPLSQTGFITPMQAGSQPADYINEASTTQTSSGRKQQQNSLPSPANNLSNTQESGPNLYIHHENRSAGGNDIPDTQDDAPFSQASVNGSSQSQLYPQSMPAPAHGPGSGVMQPPQGSSAPSRSAPPVLPPPITTTSNGATNGNVQGPSTALANILNSPSVSPTKTSSLSYTSTATPPHPPLLLPDSSSMTHLFVELADKCSGLTVEQLEQVNSVLVDTIWRTRGEWDRRRVMQDVVAGFNGVLQDMHEVGQELQGLSWENGGSRR